MKRTPLQRKTPLEPAGPLNPVSRKRQRANRERRRNIQAATGGTVPPCKLCGHDADDAHEVLSRARGGSIVDMDNIIFLCRPCHHKITTEPVWADANGWSLKSPPRRAS